MTRLVPSEYNNNSEAWSTAKRYGRVISSHHDGHRKSDLETKENEIEERFTYISVCCVKDMKWIHTCTCISNDYFWLSSTYQNWSP